METKRNGYVSRDEKEEGGRRAASGGTCGRMALEETGGAISRVVDMRMAASTSRIHHAGSNLALPRHNPPSHPVIESREDRCDSSLSHQLTRTQSLTPHFLLRSAPTMSTSRHPFSNQFSKNRPTDSLTRSEETSRVKFPPLEIRRIFSEEEINFWNGISFPRKLLHRCQRLR